MPLPLILTYITERVNPPDVTCPREIRRWSSLAGLPVIRVYWISRGIVALLVLSLQPRRWNMRNNKGRHRDDSDRRPGYLEPLPTILQVTQIVITLLRILLDP